MRTDITKRFIWLAQIGFHEGDYILIFYATLQDARDGDGEAFFPGIARIYGRGAADIGGMKGTTQPGNHAALGKDRLDHGDVIQMAGAVIAIIGDQYIAR